LLLQLGAATTPVIGWAEYHTLASPTPLQYCTLDFANVCLFLEDRLPFCLVARENGVIAAAATSVADAVRGNSSGPCNVNAYALPRATRRFAASSAHLCVAA
jgi:hypothetical protein